MVTLYQRRCTVFEVAASERVPSEQPVTVVDACKNSPQYKLEDGSEVPYCLG